MGSSPCKELLHSNASYYYWFVGNKTATCQTPNANSFLKKLTRKCSLNNNCKFTDRLLQPSVTKFTHNTSIRVVSQPLLLIILLDIKEPGSHISKGYCLLMHKQLQGKALEQITVQYIWYIGTTDNENYNPNLLSLSQRQEILSCCKYLICIKYWCQLEMNPRPLTKLSQCRTKMQPTRDFKNR